MPFRDIAKELDINIRTAHGLFREADETLVKMYEEQLGEMRRLELERLDYYQLKLWDDVEKGDHDAIELCLKISERRAKVAGFDAAVRIKVEEALNANLDEFLNAVKNALPPKYYQKILAIASEYTDGVQEKQCTTSTSQT